MNQFINPIAILRQLKGAPLSVLIALTIVQPGRVSASWLSGCTGYGHDAITRATWYLEELGFVDCDNKRSNWRLTEDSFQLPLPLSMINPDNVEDAEKPHHSPYLLTYLNKKEEIEIEASSSFNCLDDAEKPHHRTICSGINPGQTTLDLLHAAGIKDPSAINLAKLKHITFNYARAHIWKAKQEGTSIGLLIHRMKSGDPAPDYLGPRAGSEYVSGNFSEFIEH